MITNKQIVLKLKKAKNIAIFSHRDPDPDACGSMFGLREFCFAIGQKNVDVFVSDSRDKYLEFIFPFDQAKSNFSADFYDLIVLLDLHDISRIDIAFQNELYRAKELGTSFVVVDHHHVSQTENFNFKNFRIKQVAACSQMIIDLYKEVELKPTKNAATYIYAGIMGDTDRFLHPNLSKDVFENAIYLQENGAKIQEVYDYLYRYKTKNNLAMNKFFLNNLKFLDNDRVGYLLVSAKDRKKFKMGIEDVKFFANEMVTIKGVELSFLCYEKDNGEYKISLRSMEGVDLIDFSTKMGGGGHPNAAGFQVCGTKKKIEKLISVWAKEILNG